MELELKDRNVLVLAASRGLGYACALALAREGTRLLIVSRDEQRIGEAAREIAEETGAEVHPLAGDVSRPQDVERIAREALATLGQVDVMLHNAGGPPPGPALELTEEQWAQAMQQNLLSLVRFARLLVPGMRERKWGRLLTIASSSTRIPIPNLTLSNSLRLGVVGWAKTLAEEVAADGVTVNVVCPGRIQTDRLREIDEMRAQTLGCSVEEAIAATCREIPAGRYGEPRELADLVAFLASARAAYLTGGVYQVDGGLVKAV